MNHEERIVELTDLAKQLGVTIRYDKGDFEGGYCILKDQKVLLVNKRLTPQRKASVLAIAIHEIGLDNVFIKPALREYIEDEVTRALRTTK
jgi:hypothetical protein